MQFAQPEQESESRSDARRRPERSGVRCGRARPPGPIASVDRPGAPCGPQTAIYGAGEDGTAAAALIRLCRQRRCDLPSRGVGAQGRGQPETAQQTAVRSAESQDCAGPIAREDQFWGQHRARGEGRMTGFGAGRESPGRARRSRPPSCLPVRVPRPARSRGARNRHDDSRHDPDPTGTTQRAAPPVVAASTSATSARSITTSSWLPIAEHALLVEHVVHDHVGDEDARHRRTCPRRGAAPARSPQPCPPRLLPGAALDHDGRGTAAVGVVRGDVGSSPPLCRVRAATLPGRTSSGPEIRSANEPRPTSTTWKSPRRSAPLPA